MPKDNEHELKRTEIVYTILNYITLNRKKHLNINYSVFVNTVFSKHGFGNFYSCF